MKINWCFRNDNHPLILREKKVNEQAVIIICRICTRAISETSFYACDSCEYYLHNSCTDLPDVINHSFHPSHPLNLDEKYGYRSRALIYRCNTRRDNYRACNFSVDVECALMPAISSPCAGEGQRQYIQHFSHTHSLLLAHRKDGIQCKACGLFVLDLAYGCDNCDFFLHKSCAEFPRRIQLPLHPQHGSLSLCFGNEDFTCFLCKTSHKRGPWKKEFFLKCTDENYCRFHLCWSCCEKVRPTMVCEGHDHSLFFMEKIDTELAKCNAYDGYCTHPVTANSSELSRSKSSILKCLACNFKVHMLCGPLPSTIKHECHIHSLTLVDSLIADDHSDEYYCDVCETERDPRIRLYYCEDCKYSAHVHCVFSEIVKVLTEDQLIGGFVELRSVGQYVRNLSNDLELGKFWLTLHNVISNLTEEEQNLLKKYYKWGDDDDDDDYVTYKITKGQPPVDNINITNSTPQSEPTMSEDVVASLELFRFTKSDFETFFDRQLEESYSNNKLPIKFSDLASRTVDVEGYKVPHTVVRTMRALLRKYGDVSSDDSQNYSTEWKSVVYFILCEVLRRMATTLVIDITKGDLREWYHHLKFAKNVSGFKVDFACARLERLVRAFLGLQAEKLKDQVPAMLTKRVAKLEKEIAEAKSGLEICKAYTGSSVKSEFMRDCLKEASDMKWKNNRDLFSDDEQRSPMIYKTWNQ